MKKQGLKILELHLKHVENAAKANPDKYTYMAEALKEVRDGLLRETRLLRCWKKFNKKWKIKLSYLGFFNNNT